MQQHGIQPPGTGGFTESLVEDLRAIFFSKNPPLTTNAPSRRPSAPAAPVPTSGDALQYLAQIAGSFQQLAADFGATIEKLLDNQRTLLELLQRPVKLRVAVEDGSDS